MNVEFVKMLQSHLGEMYSDSIIKTLEEHVEQTNEPFLNNVFVLNVNKEKGEQDIFLFTTLRFIMIKYRKKMREETVESFFLRDITQLKYHLDEQSGDYLIVLNSGVQLSGNINPGLVGRNLINLFSKLVARQKNYGR